MRREPLFPIKAMILNETQAKVLQFVANTEMRSREQMLSLLLAEGIRFYFSDYESPATCSTTADFDPEELVRKLQADAMRCVQG
jgi:hypothetical protein